MKKILQNFGSFWQCYLQHNTCKKIGRKTLCCATLEKTPTQDSEWFR